MTDTKTCRKCSQVLPLTDFDKQGTNKNGTIRRRSYCRDCRSKVERRRWKENGGKKSPNMVPSAPLREWLLEQNKIYSWGEIAKTTGVGDRQLRRIIVEQEHISLHMADRILTAFYVHLNEIYPYEG